MTYNILLDLNPIILDPTCTINLQYITEEDMNNHFKKLFPESGRGYRDVPVHTLSKKEFEELRRKSIMETWENIINEYEQENSK